MDARVTAATVHAISLTSTQTDNQVRQVITRLNMIYPNRTKLLARMIVIGTGSHALTSMST